MNEFTLFDPKTWVRYEHYSYYMKLIKTRYNMTVTLDITEMYARIKADGLKFYPCMVYLIMKEINSRQEFRISTDKEGNPGYWDICHPQYTLFHKETETFSDVWSEYSPDFDTFYRNMVTDIATYKDNTALKPKPGKPENFISLSCLPWLSYDAVGYDSLPTSPMIFPIIIFGKYYEKEGRILIPYTMSVNHACADGFHTCRFIQELQEKCTRFGNRENI